MFYAVSDQDIFYVDFIQYMGVSLNDFIKD